MRAMRALIVAREPASRRGLRLLVRRLPGLEVVGECQDVAELLDAVGELEPDLVLLHSRGVPELLRPLSPPRAEAERHAEADRVREVQAWAGKARFAVKKPNGRITFVSVDELLWVEAAHDYMRLYTAEGSQLIRETMTRIERQLDPDSFVRIHRSTIVRVDAVTEIQYDQQGRCRVLLADGNERTVSCEGRKRLQAVIGLSV